MKSKLIYGIAVGLGSVLLVWIISALGGLDDLEGSTWNTRVRGFAKSDLAMDQIKLILLDQETLDWVESENGVTWPWPRQMYVPLLDFCKRAGVKGVAFDVLYTENSAYSVDDDEVLGDAIQNGAPFTLAMFLSPTSESDQKQVWRYDWRPPDYDIQFSSDEKKKLWVDRTERPSAYFPISRLATNAPSFGNVAEESDLDGVFRRVHFFRFFDGKWVPSLGLAMYLRSLPQPVDLEVKGRNMYINGTRHPMTEDMRGVVRYQDPDSFEKFRAAAIIRSEVQLQSGDEPEIDPARLKDSYVFFGFSAPGLKDLRPTPLSPTAPGVMIHANFLENILERRIMTEVRPFWVILLSLLLSIGGAVAVLFSRKAWVTATILVPMLLLPILFACVAYALGFWLPLVFQEMSVAIAMVSAIIVSYSTEGRQKRFLKSAFGKYVSPAVIDQIMEHPEGLELGGERKVLTIYFSDIASFSSFSETMDPEQLTALLNDYLTEMTTIIQKYGGLVDKYIGDAIVAFWNAPISQEGHEKLAARAAVECQARLNEIRETYKETYGPDLQVRMGLNTGEVIVGNMGSNNRFDYSMLGDAANLASRLEGVNKVFGTAILISEDTWNGLNHEIPGREVGQVRVVGRKKPVTVYELFIPGVEREKESDLRFMEALECCYSGQWTDALLKFRGLENDVTAQKYVDMLSKKLEDEAWDGVWNLTSK